MGRSLRTDSRGVSQIIGALFIFASVIIAFSVYQAQFIPQQNLEIEFEHSKVVVDDMKDVRSGIVSLSERGGTQTESVQLGTTYPNRVLGVNPPPPSGTLETRREGQIRFLNDNFNATELCGYEPSTRSFVYRPNYHEYRNAGKTVYENTIVYQNFSGDYIIESNQSLVNDRFIFLAPLNRTYSKTSSDSVALTFKAGPQNGTTVTTQSEVNLTFPSSLPPDVWRNNDQLFGKVGAVKDVTEADDAQFPNSITVTLKDGTYTVKCRAVGIEQQPASGQSILLSLAGPDVTSLSVSSTSVPQGDQFDLDATIDDADAGGRQIRSAEWRDATNTSHNGSLLATDGTFDEVEEDVRDLGIDTSGWSTGTHPIEVRGIDAQGNIGEWREINVTIQSTGGGSGVTLIQGIAYRSQNEKLEIYRYSSDSIYNTNKQAKGTVGAIFDWDGDGSVDDIAYQKNNKFNIYDNSTDTVKTPINNLKATSMGFAGDFDLNGTENEIAVVDKNDNKELKVVWNTSGSPEKIPVEVGATGNAIQPNEKRRLTGTSDLDSDGDPEFAYIGSENSNLIVADILNASSTEITVRRQVVYDKQVKQLGGIGDLDDDGSRDDIPLKPNEKVFGNDKPLAYYDFSRDALLLFDDQKPKGIGPTIDTDGDDKDEVYFINNNDELVYREVGNSTVVTVDPTGSPIKPKDGEVGGGN